MGIVFIIVLLQELLHLHLHQIAAGPLLHKVFSDSQTIGNWQANLKFRWRHFRIAFPEVRHHLLELREARQFDLVRATHTVQLLPNGGSAVARFVGGMARRRTGKVGACQTFALALVPFID